MRHSAIAKSSSSSYTGPTLMGLTCMEKQSRFALLFGSLSPAQQAALEKVQVALQEDPKCLDRRLPTEQETKKQENKNAV